MLSKKSFQFCKGLRFDELTLVKKKMLIQVICVQRGKKEDRVKWEKMSNQREWQTQDARELSAQTENGNM